MGWRAEQLKPHWIMHVNIIFTVANGVINSAYAAARQPLQFSFSLVK